MTLHRIEPLPFLLLDQLYHFLKDEFLLVDSVWFVESEEERARNVKLISEFLVRQKELEEEAKFALSQAKNMAKMQVQLETTSNKSLDIINKVINPLVN